jgi:hypothetical protein
MPLPGNVTNTHTNPWETVWTHFISCCHLDVFMFCSLYSQEPATGPCPEPTGSTLHSPSQSPWGPFWSHPPIYAFVFPMVSFLLAFPSKPCTRIFITSLKSLSFLTSSQHYGYPVSGILWILWKTVPIEILSLWGQTRPMMQPYHSLHLITHFLVRSFNREPRLGISCNNSP